MKHKSWVGAVAILPALLLGDQKPSCPLGPFELRSPREQQSSLFHQLSMTAEAVAPSRHRPVTPPKGGGGPSYPPAVNFIDTEIFGKMQKDGVVPAAIAGDEE